MNASGRRALGAGVTLALAALAFILAIALGAADLPLENHELRAKLATEQRTSRCRRR